MRATTRRDDPEDPMAETGGTIPTGGEDAWVAAGRIRAEEEALTGGHEGPTEAAGTTKSAEG